MERKDFLKKTALAVGALTAGTALAAPSSAQIKSTYDKLMQQVGFNHLPNKEEKTMQTVLHRAETRGHANHGWLDSHHTFSFANYYNPERVHFGVLRVLNDDVVAGGRGFDTHPHDNMEIISIPLEGALQHKDSLGTLATIRQGDVQVMSAGTGVRHSEYNANQDQAVKFLQIWVFPNRKNVPPRYDQITLADQESRNQLQQILSPNPDDAGVWIHQNAWFHLGNFDAGHTETYTLKNPATNGVYAFVLAGNLSMEGQDLHPRDGFGLWEVDKIQITAKSDARLLLMEVPMQV